MTFQAPARLPVRVDPAFAESVVWRVLTSPDIVATEVAAIHAARVEPLYDLPPGRDREIAFERLALSEFEELGPAEMLRSAIAERPDVGNRVRVVLVGEARSASEEGVTWEPGGAHLGIRVDPARFDDPERLRHWARHVLGHAEDTLDPAFGFEPHWIETAMAAPTRARLHRLWDVTVDARLEAAGHPAPSASRADHRARLAADLAGCPDPVVAAVLERLWNGARPTFAELVAWSASRGAIAEALAGATADERPDHCPLCRFPSDDIRRPEEPIARLVSAEYPDWRPDRGLCGRCTDRYRFAGRLGGAG